jgi:arylformamidase
VIFKTGNSSAKWLMADFNENFIYLSTEAAIFLRDKGVIAIGVDYLSVAGMRNGMEVHKILLEKDILIIEGLQLKDVSPGKYEMICMPLKIKGADGAPARVVLRKM